MKKRITINLSLIELASLMGAVKMSQSQLRGAKGPGPQELMANLDTAISALEKAAIDNFDTDPDADREECGCEETSGDNWPYLTKTVCDYCKAGRSA